MESLTQALGNGYQQLHTTRSRSGAGKVVRRKVNSDFSGVDGAVFFDGCLTNLTSLAADQSRTSAPREHQGACPVLSFALVLGEACGTR